MKDLVPREKVIGPLNPSFEHVIPYALGGSDGLATHDCCVSCNGTLGRTVDSACINQPLILMTRHRFGIEGQSGTIPDLVLPAHSVEGNEPATLTMPHGQPASFKHKPIVLRQDEAYGEQILVVGSDGDVVQIVSGIAAKAEKRGNLAVDPATGSELDISASIAAAPSETFNEYKIGFGIDDEALHREIMKIAFGFAHLIFGWDWTASPRARKLRALVRGAGTRADLNATVVGVDPDIRSILPMGNAGLDDHFVAFMPLGSEARIIVSLFGQDLLTAGVQIDIDGPTLEAAIRKHNRMMAVVDHQSRGTRWISFVAFTNHFGWLPGAGTTFV
jgi:hypothetical protein